MATRCIFVLFRTRGDAGPSNVLFDFPLLLPNRDHQSSLRPRPLAFRKTKD
jgi:hypothetical protein